MALDEHRKPFDTTLWHYPADGVSATAHPTASSKQFREAWNQIRDTDGATEAELSKAWEDLISAEMHEELKGTDSKLLQVWFPGVHINVGGGSDDLLKEKKGDFERKCLGRPVICLPFLVFGFCLCSHFRNLRNPSPFMASSQYSLD